MFRISTEAVAPSGKPALSFDFNGETVQAFDGQTVAQALVAANLRTCRTTPLTGSPRAPYCLMGVCFDCLVTIDGRQNRQACLVPVAPGMQVVTQYGERMLDASVNEEHSHV
jgi:sarcosine oxidase subunit alpha